MNRATSGVDELTRVELFGFDFVDDVSIEPIADIIVGSRPDQVAFPPVVVTPNTDLLLQLFSDSDDRLRTFFSNAWCVLPDGQPIVWASRLLKAPLRFRLTGSDLFAHLWPRLVDAGAPVFVLAPNDAVSDGLRAGHPQAVTIVAPMIDQSDDAGLATLASDCVAQIVATEARVAVLSLGHPKDSMIASLIIEQLAATPERIPFVLCVGGSAEMYLGLRKRAPMWVQRCSAEWLYRFAQEPRRLFHRYFVRDIGFIPLVWREHRARRRGAASTR